MYSIRHFLLTSSAFRLLAYAGTMLWSGLSAPVAAQSYLFTNGSGNSNWDTAANWLLLGSDPSVYAVPYSRSAQASITNGQVNKTAGIINLQSLSMNLGTGLNLYGGVNTVADFIEGGNIYLRTDAQNNGGAFYTNGFMELRNLNFQCLGATSSAILPFPGSTLQVNADSSITGKLGLIGGYGSSGLTNYGNINSNLSGVADPRFFIYPTLSRNYGTIQTGIGTSLWYYLNEHHNMDYGVISAPTSMTCYATQFTNHTLGLITVGGRIDVYAASQFNNYGSLTVQQLGIGADSRVSDYGSARTQVINGTLDVYGQMEAGQLSLSNSNLRTGDSTLLTLSSTSASPATSPLTINTLQLDGGKILSGTLNAANITSSNSHATRFVGTKLSGTIDASSVNQQIGMTGTTLTGGNIAVKGGANSSATLSFSGKDADASTFDNLLVQSTGTLPFSLDVVPASELTLGSNTQIKGALGQIGFNYGGQSGSKITNNGLIQTSGTGLRTFLSPAALVNNGTIQADNGANLNFGYGNNLVTNSATGTINANSTGGLVIYDGIFHNDGLVTVPSSTLQVINGVFDVGRNSLSSYGITAYNNSIVNVTQGVPNSGLYVYNAVVGNFSGGQANTCVAYNASILNISGGQIGSVIGSDTSTINISGGQINTVSTSATINVYGTNLTKQLVRTQNGVRTYALNGKLADGTVWSNKTGTESGSGNINVANLVSSAVDSVGIRELKNITHDGSLIRAQVTVTNMGFTTAQNLSLTSAMLGTQNASTTPLPSVAMLTPGASVTCNLTFPAPVAGTRVVLSLAGVYQYGYTNGRFGGSYRVTVP